MRLCVPVAWGVVEATVRMQASEIDKIAAHWAVRCEADLAPEHQALLDQWLAEDARHLGAFARAMAVAESSRRLSILDKDSRYDAVGQARAASALSRRAALAAGITVFVSGAGIGAALLRGSQTYRTHLGEVKTFTLSDGTSLSLSAISSVSVRFDRTSRDIIMAGGEALFTVAPDARPFRILAAGTEIAVSTGRVLLQRFAQEPLVVSNLEQNLSVTRNDHTIAVAPFEVIELDDDPVAAPLDINQAERALAWRDGMLALQDQPLSEAARTFARYSKQKIEFDKAETAQMRITGLFDLYDPVGFARAAAVSLGLAMRATPDVIQLAS